MSCAMIRRRAGGGTTKIGSPSSRATGKTADDGWAVQRSRYMTLETIAPLSDDPVVGLPAVAA